MKYYVGDGFKLEGNATESSAGVSTTTKATVTYDQYGYVTHLVEDVTETDDVEMHLVLNYEWSD